MAPMKKQAKEGAKPLERRAVGRRQEDGLLPNFRDLIDGAVQGILVHSNFKPLYANAAFAKLFGYDTPEEITALPLIRSLYPPDTWPEVEQDYNALIRGTKPGEVTRMLGQRRDGSEIWLSAAKRSVSWYGSHALELCVSDISKQVEMERVMMGNEQLLRSILEVLPVPVYIARRRDGRIQFVNRKTCLLLQQSAGPLLKAAAQDFYEDSQDQEKIHILIDAVHDVREIEVRMRTAQGRLFTAEIAAITMDYADEPAVLVSMNDISQRKQLEDELFHQANTDSLTGISNRRYFMVQAEQELRRARRFSRDLSVVMMDLDRFKWINDSLGHAAGDTVLEAIVKASQERLRESDVMGRLGGEEFAILLPETGLDAAMEVAGRLLEHIAETPIATVKGVVHCTTSLGVAQLTSGDHTIDDLLRRADEALYLAKDNGRNRAEAAV